MPLDEIKTEAPEERQRFARRSVLLAAKLNVDERQVDVDILDISEGGAKIAMADPAPVGTAVALQVEGVGLFASQVVWQSGDKVGLEFLTNPDAVAEDLPMIIESAKDSRERRRHVRTSVLWRAELFWGIRRADCEVLNISTSGARLRVSAEIKKGSEITLRSLRLGEHRGRVIWRDGDRFGVEFDESP